jgi:NTE family protein
VAAHREDKVLLLVSETEMAHRHQSLLALSGGEICNDNKELYIIPLPSGGRLTVYLLSDPKAALQLIEKTPLSAVVLDNREAAHPKGFSETVAGRALPDILSATSTSRRLSRSAVLVILPECELTVHHAYAVGSLQLGGVIVAPASLGAALDAVARTVQKPTPGKVALCLAGGGIEGMFYELGVLRAINDALCERSIVEFDIFSGISAGSVIAACLANGVTPGELANALKGKPSRMAPVTRGMLFDPNIGEIVSRVMKSVGDIIRGEWLKTPLDAALRVTPNAVFSGDRLRWHLEKEFSKPGMTNDFNRLKSNLFIGATDQDTATHVTFGEDGLRDVPISHAVRASCAMTPYYPPEKIKGRFYIDGIFTRTLNLDVAVAHGAKLIICVDPMSPVRSDEPGYVSGRGGLFNTVQSIKSMVRTRFSELMGRAEEAYPNVSVIVFSPTSRDLEKMSGTLMRFFYKTETEEMAYHSTRERLTQDFDWLASDFSRHGFELKRPT